MQMLILTMIASGAAGGIANYLLVPPPDGGTRNCQGIIRFTIVGIIVAFTVPLFLSLAQSGLIEKINQNSGATSAVEILIFAGFCIVASFASRAFLDTLTKKLIAEVQEAKAIAKKADQKADKADQKADKADQKADKNEETLGLVEESIDRTSGVAKPGPEMPLTEAAIDADTPDVMLSEAQENVLRAVSRLTLRTSTGIAKEAGIPRSQIGEIIDELNRKNLTEVTTSPTTGGVRHRITPLGTVVLNRILRKPG